MLGIQHIFSQQWHKEGVLVQIGIVTLGNDRMFFHPSTFNHCIPLKPKYSIFPVESTHLDLSFLKPDYLNLYLIVSSSMPLFFVCTYVV